MAIRVAVSGALGKMGQEVVKTVLADPALELVAIIDLSQVGQPINQVTKGAIASELLIQSDIKTAIEVSKAQVCVDFTHPDSALKNALAIIDAHACPVMGTTGFTPDNLQKISTSLIAHSRGGIIAPNFALGAVLMMKFAKEAAKYLDHAEIIEMHHNQKADAPSGTAIKTAELMAESQSQFGKTNAPEKEMLAGARGAKGPSAIHIHSVRLPGFIASQEVIFGAQGQLLTLRHDSIDRTSFMPGVALACKKIIGHQGLIYGLEHLLD